MSSSPPQALVRVERVSYRYARTGTPALQDIELELHAGEVLGLLGPNGAGKTTLVSVLAGLFAPGGGRRELAPGMERRGAIALVPQEHAFYPMLSCAENLEFFAAMLGLRGAARDARVAYATGLMQLEAVLRKPARECSGGLRRRLNLAIGLLGEPRLLLLDEPTAGVDPQARRFLLDAVHALRGAGTAIVYTSHYMEEVEAVSDRVAIIDNGRILRSGTLAALLRADARELHLRIEPEPDAARCAALAPRLDISRAGGELCLRLRDGQTPEEALAALRAGGLTPVAIRYGGRNLEELFLQLTSRSLRD
jgi:ABC-2 type transport system ATP-binding protein